LAMVLYLGMVLSIVGAVALTIISTDVVLT
jgi:hypothetical protein